MYWSGSRTARYLSWLSCGVTLLLVLAFAGRAAADDSLPHLREEFRKEPDPVKRAKQFHKLGNALIAEMRKQEEARNYDAIPPLFQEYYDGAKSVFDALMASGRDAEKSPKGFRELEMHLREAVHVLNDLVYAVPPEDRDPLRKQQMEIASMDERLVQVLFPRNPEKHQTPPSAPGAHPHD